MEQTDVDTGRPQRARRDHPRGGQDPFGALRQGPTRARTERFGTDGLICVLVDGFTRAEVTLIERGKAEQVLALRRSFQDAMAPEFREVVEEAVGRPVAAFLSQVNIDLDLSTEIFLLDAADGREEVLAGG